MLHLKRDTTQDENGDLHWALSPRRKQLTDVTAMVSRQATTEEAAHSDGMHVIAIDFAVSAALRRCLSGTGGHIFCTALPMLFFFFGLAPTDRGQPHTHPRSDGPAPGRNPCGSDVRSPREWSLQSPINRCQNNHQHTTRRGAEGEKKKGLEGLSAGGGLARAGIGVCAIMCLSHHLPYTLVGRLSALPFLPACFANSLSLIGRGSLRGRQLSA
ncbi:hypothetical protein LX36DRAFT_94936 [Colletotrichum falcatum]|nr:hypothetical protein LX36DRAFT_94936 [Colletotrichum falcatum]